MKQFTVRLEDAQVKQLEEMMKAHGLSKAQEAFEMMVCSYQSLHTGNDYWQQQHDDLSAEYRRLTEKTDDKINLLRSIIEEGLGKKVI